MKKIAILSTVHDWNDGRIFFREAKTLAEHYKIELHAVADFGHKTVDGIEVFGLPVWKTFSERVRNIRMILNRALKSDADFFHFHDPEILLIVPVIKLIKRKPIVYDVHEHYPGMIKDKAYIPAILRNLISFLFRVFEHVSLAFISQVFFITDLVGQRYKKMKKDKASLLPNLPSLSLFKEEPLPYKRRPKRILYLGGVTKVRGICELIQAFSEVSSKYPEYELLIVGKFFSEEFYNSLKNEIEKLNLTKRVLVKDKLPYPEIKKVLKNARIGIVTYLPFFNHKVGLPNKLFEYMASGLPIIASNFENYQYFIKECQCGVGVNPADINMIATAIMDIIKDEKRASRMAINSRKAFVTKYNWETASAVLLDAYKKLS